LCGLGGARLKSLAEGSRYRFVSKRRQEHTMNPFKKLEMMEATHLTREGRLKEAMELLLGSFGSSKFEATAPRSAPEYSTATLRLPPPRTGSSDTLAERSPDGRTERRTTQIPRPFGTLLDQMTQVGSAPRLEGLRGLVARSPSPVPDGARFEERTYANAAGSRSYKLFVPSGYIGSPAGDASRLQTIAR
jgi:hypothetical protein